MLARGNGDGAERVARTRGRAEWGERQYPGWKDGDEVARGARFLPLMGLRSEPTSVTEKRTKKEKTAPKALLYLSYNYHNRAPHRAPPLPTNPARAPRVPGHNRKLETLEYIFPSSLTLVRSLARSLAALEIVRRRTSAVESEGC